MVNNHGDRKSPKDRVVPLTNCLFMAYKWGLQTTYLRPGIPSSKYPAPRHDWLPQSLGREFQHLRRGGEPRVNPKEVGLLFEVWKIRDFFFGGEGDIYIYVNILVGGS